MDVVYRGGYTTYHAGRERGKFSDAADDDAVFLFGKCAQRLSLHVASRRDRKIYTGHYAVIRRFADHNEVVLTCDHVEVFHLYAGCLVCLSGSVESRGAFSDALQAAFGQKPVSARPATTARWIKNDDSTC